MMEIFRIYQLMRVLTKRFCSRPSIQLPHLRDRNEPSNRFQSLMATPFLIRPDMGETADRWPAPTEIENPVPSACPTSSMKGISQ